MESIENLNYDNDLLFLGQLFVLVFYQLLSTLFHKLLFQAFLQSRIFLEYVVRFIQSCNYFILDKE